MGRDEDLVDGRLRLSKRVAHRRRRISLDDVAVGRNAGLAQVLERALEPAARRRAPRVAVHDVTTLRLAHRRDDGDAYGVAARRKRVAERLGVDGLVRDQEDVRHTGTSYISRAFE